MFDTKKGLEEALAYIADPQKRFEFALKHNMDVEVEQMLGEAAASSCVFVWPQKREWLMLLEPTSATRPDYLGVCLFTGAPPVHFTSLVFKLGWDRSRATDFVWKVVDRIVRAASPINEEEGWGLVHASSIYLQHLDRIAVWPGAVYLALTVFAESGDFVRATMRLLPGEYGKAALEDDLRRLTEYLTQHVGISKSNVHTVFLRALRSGKLSLPHFAAVAMVYEPFGDAERATFRGFVADQLLWALRRQLSQSGHIHRVRLLEVLTDLGLWDRMGEPEMTEGVRREFVHLLAAGRVALAYQYALLFAKHLAPLVGRRGWPQTTAESLLEELTPAAYRLALENGEPGIAAALVQRSPHTPAEEKLRVLNMAVAVGKPITLVVDEFVIPPGGWQPT